MTIAESYIETIVLLVQITSVVLLSVSVYGL